MVERISFLNDKFINHKDGKIHLGDCGLQFGDGVYEVILYHNNKLVECDPHLDRLFESLAAIRIDYNKTKQDLKSAILELFRRNNMNDGALYLQVTRGDSPDIRYLGFPKKVIPTTIMTVNSVDIALDRYLSDEFQSSAITCNDIRWSRCDIKSTSLLAPTLLKQEALDKGCDEAILVRDNYITEGSFANIFIVDKNDRLITREADGYILKGITRDKIIELAKEHNIEIIEKKFSKNDLYEAKEIFSTSSTILIKPLLKIDGKIVGNAKVGQITRKIINLYKNHLNN